MAGAARVLEIGTLGGYSTVWPARALLRYSTRSRAEPRLSATAVQTVGAKK